MNSQARRLRVLFVVDYGGALGGAERFVIGLAMHMPRDRVEAWVCSTRQGDETAVRALQAAEIPHVSLGRQAKWDVHKLGGLASLLRRERFDVLHAHKFGSNLWGTLIGRWCRVPVILAHEHNWAYTGDPLRMWLDRRLIGGLATRFIAVSEMNRRQMIELERIPPERILVMPTGYVPHTDGSGGDVRAELGVPPDLPMVGVAAGLRTEKALDVMLDAHARVVSRLGRAHLVIAGEGVCLPALQEQVDRLQLGDSVTFLGRRRDVDAILRAVNVGAMSSNWEGMPLFVFECMAARTPIVATAVGGLPEIVENGNTGLLVPPQDPEALAEAITAVLTDRSLADRIAANAAARLHEFEIDVVARRFATLYEELLTEARQP